MKTTLHANGVTKKNNGRNKISITKNLLHSMPSRILRLFTEQTR